MLPVRLALLPSFAASLCPLSKASSRRARQIVGGVSRPESRVQVRQTTQQVHVQRFGLTTDDKAAPSSRLRQSPPQSQQMCCFHAPPYLLWQPISHSFEGHYRIVLYFAARRRRSFCTGLEARTSGWARALRCVLFLASLLPPANMSGGGRKIKKKKLCVVKTNQS